MENSKNFKEIIIRYSLILILGLSNFWIFYLIFSPLTIYLTYFFTGLFFKTALLSNSIIIGKYSIVFIDACIAGSAYYLLFILNFSILNLDINKRCKLLFLTFISFFILNVLRIFFLIVCLIYFPNSFDFSHKLFWYLGSTIFVILIWFFYYKKFRIKEIPFYSDLKFIYKSSLFKKT
jgi:exosortase/archaeosortase family protein